MMHIVGSEWLKLRRKAMLGAVVASVLVAVFGAVIAITTATGTKAAAAGPAAPGGPGGTSSTSIEALSTATGLGTALTQTGTLLGVIALSAVAASVAGEYSFGTLRNLLVNEPRRLRLLLGKLLTLITAVAATTVLAASAAAVAAYLLAGGQAISTATWTSSAGLAATAAAVANLVLANIGWALFGAVLAIALRSPVAAVGIGVAYALPLETILGLISNSVTRWLPGKVLAAVAAGGTEAIGYSAGLATLTAYGVVAVAGMCLVFARRDVAS